MDGSKKAQREHRSSRRRGHVARERVVQRDSLVRSSVAGGPRVSGGTGGGWGPGSEGLQSQAEEWGFIPRAKAGGWRATV